LTDFDKEWAINSHSDTFAHLEVPHNIWWKKELMINTLFTKEIALCRSVAKDYLVKWKPHTQESGGRDAGDKVDDVSSDDVSGGNGKGDDDEDDGSSDTPHNANARAERISNYDTTRRYRTEELGVVRRHRLHSAEVLRAFYQDESCMYT
jgi:hypothetical protein